MKFKFFFLILFLFFQFNIVAQTDSITFQVVKELNEEGRYEEAIDLLNNAIKKTPSNHLYYKEKAFSLRMLDKLYDAIMCLNEGVDRNPNNPFFLYERGTHFMIINSFATAILDYDKALKSGPFPDSLKLLILRNRGLAKTYEKDFDEAFSNLEEALKLDTNDISTICDLSITYMAIENYHKAISLLTIAYKINNTNISVLHNLGYLYTLTEQYKKAIGILNKTIKLYPTSSAYNNRGYAFMKLGKLEDAELDINVAIKLDSDNSYAYRNKALLFIEENNIQEACYALKKSHELGYTKQYDNQVQNLINKYCK